MYMMKCDVEPEPETVSPQTPLGQWRYDKT